MAIELPYFKFVINDWDNGDITLESLDSQGLFINICSYYWSKECNITFDNLKRKFYDKNSDVFDSLFERKIIKKKGEKVSINFLNEQFLVRKNKSKKNSSNGKKGGRGNIKTVDNTGVAEESENKANALKNKSEKKPIRVEKKRVEKKRVEKNIISSRVATATPDRISEKEKSNVDWVIKKLNEEIGSKFSSETKSTVKLILARIKEGRSSMDFKKVIIAKSSQWKGTDQAKYLRPETLFNATKFESYINEISAISPPGKPLSANEIAKLKNDAFVGRL